MKTAPAIGFSCRRSPSLIVVTFVIAMLAVAASQWTGSQRWLHLLLLLLAVAFLLGGLRNLVRSRVAAVLWHPDGGADITLRDSAAGDGRVVQGAVQGGRSMGPLIVLTLRWPPRARAHVWLLPDNLDADTRRRLRMRLGSGAPPGLASGGADSR